MELGARVSGYHCQKSFYRVIPHLKFNYDLSQSAKLNLNLGIRNQYLFRLAFLRLDFPPNSGLLPIRIIVRNMAIMLPCKVNSGLPKRNTG